MKLHRVIDAMPWLLVASAIFVWIVIPIRKTGPVTVKSYLGGKVVSEVVYTNPAAYQEPRRLTWDESNIQSLLDAIPTNSQKAMTPGGVAR